jgi:NAD(P)-dependent dehydrogenase (short-subunit alcohol dehydrogenase family)
MGPPFAVNVRRRLPVRGVLPGMQAHRFGRVINIGSDATPPVPGLAAYCVSKHALRALTG